MPLRRPVPAACGGARPRIPPSPVPRSRGAGCSRSPPATARRSRSAPPISRGGSSTCSARTARGGWARLGSTYGVIRLDGTVEWQEQEDAVLGPTSFLAQISPAPNATGFAAVREAVGVPPEIVFKRTPKSRWLPVTSFNADLARGFEHYPEVRAVTWAGAGGLAMEGLVLLPRDRAPGPLPLVVDIHGGPTWSAKHAFNPGFALPFAAAGFAVFLPNYRGNVGWGQAF